MMARTMEFNYSVTLPFSFIVENTTISFIVENTSKPTPFENPFSKPSIRVIFSIVYALVFTVCLVGK